MMAYRTDIRPCGQGGRSPGVRLYDDLCGLILSSSILKGRWRLPNRHKRVVPTIGIKESTRTGMGQFSQKSEWQKGCSR